jgi:hypothetical protein
VVSERREVFSLLHLWSSPRPVGEVVKARFAFTTFPGHYFSEKRFGET